MKRAQGQAALLQWCRERTKGYPGVDIQNFSQSWGDGLAFCALIHNYDSSLINFNELKKEDRLNNCQLAFDVAESKLKISKLLDAEDVADIPKPEPLSMITYVSQFYHAFSKGNLPPPRSQSLTNLSSVAQGLDNAKPNMIRSETSSNIKDLQRITLNDINSGIAKERDKKECEEREDKEREDKSNKKDKKEKKNTNIKKIKDIRKITKRKRKKIIKVIYMYQSLKRYKLY